MIRLITLIDDLNTLLDDINVATKLILHYTFKY